MSISAMDRVWRLSKASKGDLLIMLAIADFANDAGEAWPSVSTLAKKSRLKERHTQYAIRRLEDLGELKIHKNKGPRGCHV
jgi:DNA-binding transcriptional regulator YhcF (GntR family)